MEGQQGDVVGGEDEPIHGQEDERDYHDDNISRMNGGRSGAVAVEHSAVFLEGVDHVEGSDGAGLAVFGVAETVADHAVEEIVDVVSDMGVDLE